MFIVLSTLPDRITTLLNITNLSNRIVNTIDDVEKMLNSEIDWASVNKKIEYERNKSIKWIYNAIESDKDE